ncbi:SsrA-binding protein SmpB [Blochmannia endosymbiont of Polyrhachis (Hedomyrma) turneri]|uniref:SsrA-binding protein SmpB n=1 Tax=Blochmannia endosymbiont of Polyrhachis (Hedomyrma) turneri TaxID=1505596 RepID=UPI00061A5EC6|nr:SsrA-binding protein SmpB [Blochmannia endosymbiont of Polyrhachis (Hedomyrma) turneri]AKC60108.1 ssrA-binding protein [Blochmannia endosymbiont of Polyrhachis (Hedomyrma) turneri]
MHKKIIQNKYANYQYFIIKKLEAGISLQGWEVKAIRAKKIEINHAYIFIKNNEAYTSNIIIHPITTASSHIQHDISRHRKLLLKKNELHLLSKENNNFKYTIIPLELYWKNQWIKISIGIGKGKKQYDKRAEIKKREWLLDKNKVLF